MPRILLVDDEPSILSVLNTLLKTEGYDVEPVQGGERARELVLSTDYDLLLSDIRMSPINGMELLKVAREKNPPMTVIMLTAYGSVETAIEALKLGAFDYITKPFKVDELLITIQRALEFSNALSENAELKQQLGTRYQFENIVAESPSMKNVCDMIKRVALTDTTVLIQGDTGTGKELVAKAIHGYSRRKSKKFLAVNCAALPEALLESEMFGHVKGAFTGASTNKEGLFEAVGGGTIFLDEVGSIPLSVQGKLLRVLQEKEVRRVGGNDNMQVDARVLAATNTPLEELIKQGTFREDLFYRLSVIPIQIAPLSQRREDILPIVMHVLSQETPEHRDPPRLAPEVNAILESYQWPGNVRELENAIKHAMTFAENNTITKECLPPRIANVEISAATAGGTAGQAEEGQWRSLKSFLRAKEQEYLKHVLRRTGGDKERAAQELNISLATLYRKLPEAESSGNRA